MSAVGILAGLALVALTAYGLMRWVIYIIVWQPWVKVEAVPHPERVHPMNLKQLWSIIRGRQTNFSWMHASWTYYPDGDPVRIKNSALTQTQKVYGLLWQEISDRPRIHEARRILLASMTKDEQREAIAWVKQHAPITEREILEKSP